MTTLPTLHVFIDGDPVSTKRLKQLFSEYTEIKDRQQNCLLHVLQNDHEKGKVALINQFRRFGIIHRAAPTSRNAADMLLCMAVPH